MNTRDQRRGTKSLNCKVDSLTWFVVLTKVLHLYVTIDCVKLKTTATAAAFIGSYRHCNPPASLPTPRRANPAATVYLYSIVQSLYYIRAYIRETNARTTKAARSVVTIKLHVNRIQICVYADLNTGRPLSAKYVIYHV